MLVTVAAGVFLGDAVFSAILLAVTPQGTTSLPESLLALGLIAAVLALELWVASALLRRSRRGWLLGIAFAVFMLLPVGWDASLPLPNAIYAVISTGAFAFVIIALWRERGWFRPERIASVSQPA